MDNQQLSNIRHIQNTYRNKSLVLFVGAGVSMNSGVPSWNALINELKKELPVSLQNEKDDLKVAQLYKDSRGDKEYIDSVKRILRYRQAIPNPIHEALIALNPSHFITTNYDNLLEQSIDASFKQFSVVKRDKDIPNIGYPNTLIKMHGDFELGNIVLSENDYYDYARNFPLIRSYVLSLFASKFIVFVGFSFSDLNLKMILRELQSVLTKDMQRVYLLSLEKPDEITVEYFHNKGINIVYCSDSEITEMLQCCDKKPDVNIDSLNAKGRQLYYILHLFKYFNETFMEDPIKVLYSLLDSYKDDIRAFGDGIRHILPANLSKYWSPYSNGIQTFSKYIKRLENKLSNFDGKKKFLEEHDWLRCRVNRSQLKKFAYYNYAFNIDNICIVDDYFIKHIEEYIPSDSIDCFYDFDLNKLEDNIQRLKTRKLNGTIADLEYPYLLCKINNFYQAYEEYNKILAFAWHSHRYIVYFLALYNRWTIRYMIKMQYFYKVPKEIESIVESLEDTNIEEVLNSLPVAKEIKNFLYDVITNKAISRSIVKLSDLNTKLQKQRISSEKGGWSYNSHIEALIAHYEREFLFNNWNYLYMDNNDSFKNVCNTTIHGIFNSYTTKGNKQQTKLVLLDKTLVQLLVFNSGDNDNLWEILNMYNITHLDLDEESKVWLKTVISNLYSNKTFAFWKESIKANLLTIIALGKIEDIDRTQLFNLLMSSLNDARSMIIYKKVITTIFKNYSPLIDDATEILYFFLNIKNRSNDYFEVVNKLVIILHENNISIEYNKIELNDTDDCIGLIYPIIEVENRSKLVEYYCHNYYMFEWFMHFIVYYNIPVTDVDLFKKDLFSYCTSFEGNRAGLCRNLLSMRQNQVYSNLYDIIDDYGKSVPCMNFLKAPLDYTDEIEIEWLFECEQKDIERLLKSHVTKDKLKKKILSNLWSEQRVEKLLKYL